KHTASEGPLKRALGVSINYYGVSLGARGEFYDKAGALVTVEKDGSVRVAVGNTEMGQGALTVLSQICAETLNAPYAAVRLIEADSSKVPDSGPTVASRTTLMSGNAILDACKPIRERIFATARELLDAPEGKISASGGVFSFGERTASFKEAVNACWKKRLKMSEQGWYTAPKTSFRLEDGQGDAYVVFAFSADIADVAVDTETGEARVVELFAAHELGKAVNPQQVEGQIQGGALQAIGYALYENLIYKDGIMVNPNLTDYIIPSAMETPQFNLTIVEKPYSEGPFGAKGFGETPLIGPAPAIANAIKRAVGARVCRLPMLPERILEEINTPGSSKPQGSLKA
ncbi:MAG TPA: molybdopterin-dependent oxidoreductase, partial [Elusimicrobiales bacterium]|nr:molybdopterin-dependent oxidoreductase [Elusimicrobiales bacterium]